MRISLLFLTLSLLVARELLVPVGGTSDATIKRRTLRFASMAERAQEEAAANTDTNSTLEGESKYFDHPLSDDLGETFGDSNLTHLRQRANMTYLQCMYQAQRFLKLEFATHDEMKGEFVDVEGNRTTSHNVTKANPCGLHWINRGDLFSGIDKVILVGDSTILRDFWYIIHAPKGAYSTKVAELPRVSLNTTLRLTSGRLLPIIFFRLLYASVIDSVLDDVFEVATRNSLIMFSLGPHDTSWLIFDKVNFKSIHAMPGMHVVEQKNRKQSRAGVMAANLKAAQMYWEKYSTIAVNKIGIALRNFEQNLLDNDPLAKSYVFRRPVVVFREQFLPKCSDPKYATNPHTKCVTWLKPIIVPFMRSFLRARLTLLNIPTISMDWVAGRFTHICYLQDAGHLPRRCKNVELVLAVTAFRQARRYVLQQGFPLRDDVLGPSPAAHRLLQLDGIMWHQVANLVTMLRPRGIAHYDARLGLNPPPLYEFPPLFLPTDSVSKNADYRKMIARFDILAMSEREVSGESDFGSHTSLLSFNESSLANTTNSATRRDDVSALEGKSLGASSGGGGSAAQDAQPLSTDVADGSNEGVVAVVKIATAPRYDISDDTTTMILFVFGVFTAVVVFGYRRSFG